MAAIVCRIAKLKTLAHVGAVRAHNSREHEVGHADPERSHLNRTLVGSGDLLADVQAKLSEVDGPLRKNGVIAVEMILTANSEWFAEDNARADAFADRAIQCLEERYGDRLVNAELHLDEAAPHVHAIVVPTELKADGKVKLNCRGEFGGAAKLKQLQDWAGELGKPLGLERGKSRVIEVEGEEPRPAIHKAPAEYRREQAEAANKAKAEAEAAEAAARAAADLREAAAADRAQAAKLVGDVKTKLKTVKDCAAAEVARLRAHAVDLRRQATLRAFDGNNRVEVRGQPHDINAMMRGAIYKAAASRGLSTAERAAREAMGRHQSAQRRLAQAEAKTASASILTRWWHRMGETPLRQEVEATGTETREAEQRKAEIWEQAKKSPAVEQAKAHAEALRRAARAEVDNMANDADTCDSKANSIERVHELGQYSPEARQAAAAAQAVAQASAKAAKERVQAAQLEHARPSIFAPDHKPKLPGDKAEGNDGPKFMPQPAGPTPGM